MNWKLIMLETLSHSIRKRFVKDFDLPITIVQDPWWEHYLTLYNNHFEIKERLALLYKALEICGSEKIFFDESDRLSESIIKDISESEAYKNFNTKALEIDQNAQDEANKWLEKNGNKDLFIAEHAGKCFVSLDMKQANFNTLKWYNPELVLNCDTWEILLEKYNSPCTFYFSSSKYFRQVVFGHLNPRRQRSLIRFLNTTKVLPLIQTQKIINVTEDQCVFEIPDMDRNDLVLETLKWEKKLEENCPVAVSVKAFKLIRLGDKPYYVQAHGFGETFKCVPAHYFGECYKYYYSLEPEDLDAHTWHEGRIVKYIHPLF